MKEILEDKKISGEVHTLLCNLNSVLKEVSTALKPLIRVMEIEGEMQKLDAEDKLKRKKEELSND